MTGPLPPGVGLHWPTAAAAYTTKQAGLCGDCGRIALCHDPVSGLPRHKVCAELSMVRSLGVDGARKFVADYWAAHRKAEREGAR